MTTPRALLLIAALLLPASVHSAEAKKPAKKAASKKASKTWAMLVEHVLAKGSEWPIKASSSRTLGYDSESVPAKSLGIEQEKSSDNREHGVFVVYENDDKGKPKAKEVVLHNQRVVEKDGDVIVEGYKVRSTLDGTVLQGFHAAGTVGKNVVQTPLPADSTKLQSIFKSEREMYLQKLDWNKLSAE
ncbi:MAG: hypothetical protein M0D55_01875 [Elusimicrobiota bacterium]|nr:MAG: hypothetical protein M0D55_01875 [Elusimicrobiota bacterium]